MCGNARMSELRPAWHAASKNTENSGEKEKSIFEQVFFRGQF